VLDFWKDADHDIPFVNRPAAPCWRRFRIAWPETPRVEPRPGRIHSEIAWFMPRAREVSSTADHGMAWATAGAVFERGSIASAGA
jgi:hypothetical protein